MVATRYELFFFLLYRQKTHCRCSFGSFVHKLNRARQQMTSSISSQVVPDVVSYEFYEWCNSQKNTHVYIIKYAMGILQVQENLTKLACYNFGV